MHKLLASAAVASIVMAMPVSAQPAPPTPPGVAQGTTPVTPPTHRPPVIYSPAKVHAVRIQHEMRRDEVVQHVRAMFSHLDANHDGFVTKDELATVHVGMMGMHPAMAAPMRMDHGSMDMEHHGHSMDMGAMFDRLDTNHDGSISRQEFAAAHTRMEERRVIIMRNDNGAPGEAGMAAMHMGMGGGRMAERLFSIADANHDGRVSLQEAEAAALAHFDRVDRNHDGAITPDERRQMHVGRERRPS